MGVRDGLSKLYSPPHGWPQSDELTSPPRQAQQSLGICTAGPSQLPRQHS
jgi:hypothetical protein